MAAKFRGRPECILALLLSAGTCPASGQTRVLPPVVFTQLPAKASVGVQPGDGARLMLFSGKGAVQPLLDGFHSAADPDVSFDGSVSVRGPEARCGRGQTYSGRTSVRQTRVHDRSPSYQSKIYLCAGCFAATFSVGQQDESIL
jgi:hypothetical protein